MDTQTNVAISQYKTSNSFKFAGIMGKLYMEGDTIFIAWMHYTITQALTWQLMHFSVQFHFYIFRIPLTESTIVRYQVGTQWKLIDKKGKPEKQLSHQGGLVDRQGIQIVNFSYPSFTPSTPLLKNCTYLETVGLQNGSE